MSLPVVSAIVAHKFAAALIAISLVTSGGAVAVASNGHISNVVGELSFVINPSYVNVTSLASLNLGTLTPGQTGTQSSTAKVNVTDSGSYGISLVNTELLHDAFSVFNVTIIVSGPVATPVTPVTLSLNHPTQSLTFTTGGIDALSISVLYTVNTGSSIQRGITASNAPFLELISVIPVPTPQTSTIHTSTSSSVSTSSHS
jgi:hypothetical protein